MDLNDELAIVAEVEERERRHQNYLDHVRSLSLAEYVAEEDAGPGGKLGPEDARAMLHLWQSLHPDTDA